MARDERRLTNDALHHRRNLVRILFVHRSLTDVKCCLHELKRARLPVKSAVAGTPRQLAVKLRSLPFDVVVAEYPNPNWNHTEVQELLAEMKKDLPLIFLVQDFKRETAAELILKGAADCVEANSAGHLPIAIHRALHQKSVREQRDRAEKDLRRSQAHYYALAGNLSYGICRCNRDGRFVEVNRAMVKMLGYETREELLALGLACETVQDPTRRARLLGQSQADAFVRPLEVEWKRKDHTTLKVYLSGREVPGEQGELESFEVIVEDVTRQRELEDRLRREAASDPLTGLANYRRLADVLDLELQRSKRTSRRFALLFFDLDGLKVINDKHGHVIGNRALCRFADILCSGCRDIDTPARFGGDEFALVLPEISPAEANTVAERVRENLAHDGKEPKVSVTFGVATYPEDGETIESLLSNADRRLYRRKQRRAITVESSQATGDF